jgi:hypothetical protein
MTSAWAQRQAELLSSCIVSPHVLGFFAQPPDRVYSRDSTNQTHVGVPWIAKLNDHQLKAGGFKSFRRT